MLFSSLQDYLVIQLIMLPIYALQGLSKTEFVLSDKRNMTLVTEFILLGFMFSSHRAESYFFFVILFIYFCTMAGNLLILALVFSDQRLRSPMYFFLSNLSILDICFINITVPKMLQGLLPGGKTISLVACLAQSFLFFLVGVSNFLLLAVMSFDRYVAICHPLRYSIIMHQQLCVRLMFGVWMGAFFSIVTSAIGMMRLSYCSSVLNHFFCDVMPLLMNACVNTDAIQLQEVITSSIMLLTSLFIVFVSYAKIMKAILKIHSAQGRQKAFSTCSSHALVVLLAYGSCIFTYVRPAQGQSSDYNKKVAILTTVVVPLLNPYIYTLRNQRVREILRENLTKSAILKKL